MAAGFTASARRLGIVSGVGTVFLSALYTVPLLAGLLSLPSPDAPIGDPWFSMMEILIILTMPFMVGLMVAVQAWASPETRVFSLLALVFMGLVTGLTCSLHFVILTVSHQAEFAGQSWLPLLLSFKWLSVTYALDILAWDVFFALAVLSAAPVFSGSRLARSIRLLMIISGALALGGVSGVILHDAQFRNIGIVGYAGVFPWRRCCWLSCSTEPDRQRPARRSQDRALAMTRGPSTKRAREKSKPSRVSGLAIARPVTGTRTTCAGPDAHLRRAA